MLLKKSTLKKSKCSSILAMHLSYIIIVQNITFILRKSTLKNQNVVQFCAMQCCFPHNGQSLIANSCWRGIEMNRFWPQIPKISRSHLFRCALARAWGKVANIQIDTVIYNLKLEIIFSV